MTPLTTAQAAAQLGCSRRRISQLIASGRLRAQRVGWQWLIAAADLDAVRVRKPGWRKGRPRGPRPARA